MTHRADVAAQPAGNAAAGGEPTPARAGHDLAAAALALAIAAAVARMLPDGPVRLTLLLAFTIAGPGAAFVSHLWIPDRVLAIAMTLTASLSISALTAGGMVWAAWWHPDVLTVVMISLTAATALARLVGWTPQPPGWQLSEGPRSPEAASAHGVRMVSAALSPVLLVVALGVWAVTVARSDSGQVGDYGLTAGLGVPFVAGLAMTCLAFGIELFGRVRVGVLIAGVGSVALQVFGTAPLLLTEPEYAWTYKHLGVVELIQQHGRVLDPADIYQQWPGFFASVAQLSTVSGVAPIRFATWSSLFFAVLDAVLLAAAARALTTDRRVVFLAVFLFECCLWVDQNYFSPQAFAYALSLGFFAILLHWCRGEPTNRRPWWIGRLQGMLVRQAPPAVDVRGGAARLRVIGLVGVFAAITVAHQLTPYLLLFGVGMLTVLGLIRPYWLIVLLAVVAGGYFLPRLSGVSSQYHLFDGFDLFKNASGNASGWGSDAQRFSATLARLLAFAVWGSTRGGARGHPGRQVSRRTGPGRLDDGDGRRRFPGPADRQLRRPQPGPQRRPLDRRPAGLPAPDARLGGAARDRELGGRIRGNRDVPGGQRSDGEDGRVLRPADERFDPGVAEGARHIGPLVGLLPHLRRHDLPPRTRRLTRPGPALHAN
jgi:hypothetical protein